MTDEPCTSTTGGCNCARVGTHSIHRCNDRNKINPSGHCLASWVVDTVTGIPDILRYPTGSTNDEETRVDLMLIEQWTKGDEISEIILRGRVKARERAMADAGQLAL